MPSQTVAIDIESLPAHRPTPEERELLATLRAGGLTAVRGVEIARRVLLDGAFEPARAKSLAMPLLADPVTEQATFRVGADASPARAADVVEFEIHPRPGVMDPTAATVCEALRGEGLAIDSVRTARLFRLTGVNDAEAVLRVVRGRLANDCIEEIIPGTAGVRPPPQPPQRPFEIRTISIRGLDAASLQQLSRTGALFLSLDEMQTIQRHFVELGRDPTDLELETLAQTWSEHCVHKTLKSAVRYVGASFPGVAAGAAGGGSGGAVEIRYENLLKDTIARATRELMGAGRGPKCLSVFADNAGIIDFDAQYGIAFKVETHNHPSAIEPYGGAATGVGGCIRDVIGCGLAAKPIASTDVFCVAPADFPEQHLPRGVLSPRFVLRGVVQGVADYGNRMGIPTVNGAVVFDVRYLANPLVYCGSVGLIPKNRIDKRSQPGDYIVVIGGRTGRDGIHGATFSSAEMTDTHVDEFAHAVQIGNAIEEKRVLDAVLRARDSASGCLFSAITDCGAGGLSSAVGEMGAEIGARVELAGVPLKYAGLRYDEIWISEAQERMVLSVPPAKWDAFRAVMEAEEVEATRIGEFGYRNTRGEAALRVEFDGRTVGELGMEFLHEGLPKRTREARWTGEGAVQPRQDALAGPAALEHLRAQLARPNLASKEWIVRRYDHEVQGGSVVKPFVGPGRGPGNAAVVRPRLESSRGIAVGCGLCPSLADVDPYWMAVNAFDEAIRNVVCVGGDPAQTAVLDNFCWGGVEDPHDLGTLVRACQACYDAAMAYGAPFISGKDSLNNQFALGPEDVPRLIQALNEMAALSGPDAEALRAILPRIEQRIRSTGRIAVPPTLLISSLSIVPDVSRSVTSDLKPDGGDVWLVGGLPQIGFDLRKAAETHRAVHAFVREGMVRACQDVSEGGWLACLAEMAIGGKQGVRIGADAAPGAFQELAAGYVVQFVAGFDAAKATVFAESQVRVHRLACLVSDSAVEWGPRKVGLQDLAAAWRSLAR